MIFHESNHYYGLEEHVWALLKERAEAQGASVNATVKGILEQALGVKRIPQQPHRHDPCPRGARVDARRGLKKEGWPGADIATVPTARSASLIGSASDTCSDRDHADSE